MRLAVMMRNANAPSIMLSASTIEWMRGRCALRVSFLIRWASTSLSDDDWKRLPLFSR